MGLNTVVVILNDHLSSIEKDPDFGRELAYAILAYPSDRYRGTAAFRVVSMAHSDYEQIVSVQGNIGAPISAEDNRAIRLARQKREKQRRRKA